MKIRLKNNLRKVLKKLEDGSIKYISFLPLGVSKTSLTDKPIIYLENSILTSNSINNFSFYILPNAIRGVFKSINFYLAGNLIIGNKMYSPSILNYYTSAFSSIETLLAFNGVLYFYPSYTFDDNQKIIDDYKMKLLRYSVKKNLWTIENKKIGHKERWYEIKDLYKTEELAPAHIINLYKGLFNPEFYNRVNKNENFTYEKNSEEFYKLISNVRHESAYNGRGFDTGIYYEEINGEEISEAAKSKREKIFQSFAEDLILTNLNMILNLIDELEINKNVIQNLLIVTIRDFFDDVLMENIQNEKIRLQFQKLNDWIRVNLT